MIDDATLKELSNVDLETVNKNQLKELNEIILDSEADINTKIEMFLTQIQNPYCFLVNGTPVKIVFENKKTLEECLFNYFKTINGEKNDKI